MADRRGATPRDLRRGKYVILDDSATKRFGAFAVGDYREFNGQRLKIIGRTAEARSFTTNPIAFLDYRVAQSLDRQSLHNRTTYIVVKLAAGADAEAVRAEIRRRLPYNDVWTRDEWAARSRSYWTDSTGLGLNMIMTVFLGCLVGVVVVAQTLYTSTMEHLKEFATVKAIGGGNAEIYGMIAEQAAIAAVVGFALGAVHGLRPPAGHGRDRPEADPDPELAVCRLRRDAGALPGGLRDLVPQGRLARPGPGLPRLTHRCQASVSHGEPRRGRGARRRPPGSRVALSGCSGSLRARPFLRRDLDRVGVRRWTCWRRRMWSRRSGRARSRSRSSGVRA